MKGLAIFFGILFVCGVGLVAGMFFALGGTPDAVIDAFYDGSDYIQYNQTIDSDTGIDEIFFDIDNRKININESADDKFYLSYYATESDEYVYSAESGKLSLTSNEPFKFLDFSWIYTLSKPEIMIVTLKVPARFDGSMDIKTSNGNISAEEISGSTMALNTSNGSVTVKNSDFAGQTSLKTSNGSISAESINAAAITLNTSNGSVNVKNSDFAGEAALKASNGSITVKDSDFAGQTSLKTSNGRITTEYISAPGLTADTSNGSINLGLKGSPDEYKYEVHTSNADCSINGQKCSNGTYGTGAKHIKATTSNGNITIKVPA